MRLFGLLASLGLLVGSSNAIELNLDDEGKAAALSGT
jgi:hypothetical protein